MYEGDVAGLRTSGTLTGEHLARHQPLKREVRRPTGALRIEHATRHNLQDVSVTIPRGVLTVVTGVAGSGKSSLVHGYVGVVEPGAVIVDQRLGRGSRRSNPATDEPTTGLHMHDVDRLVGLLDRLVDSGATVVVIEHDLDVVARADWVIDLGPGAGQDGGRVVFEGTPVELVAHPTSLTGQHLALRHGG